MRRSVLLAAALLAACATEKLAVTPPVGVDLSGHWLLDEADSDDPMRLLQTQLVNSTANAGPAGSTGSGGQHGQQGGGGASRAPMGPNMPPVTVLNEALRWPGKSLVITQSGGNVTFASGGRSDACRPGLAAAQGTHQPPNPGAANRDLQTHGRGDPPPPVCGWDDQTLVVNSGDPDNDPAPFERRFHLSDGGQRLIEIVAFVGGRSSGFTASRVWTRAPSGTNSASPAAAPAPDPPAGGPRP